MKLTKKEATDVIANMIQSSELFTECNARSIELLHRYGAFEVGNKNCFSFENPYIWASNCGLDIDGARRKVEVTWSSTSRSLAMAAAALEIYSKTLKLANKIQAFLDCVDVK